MARHALLIGVQDYTGSGNMTPLACPRADVDLMYSLLTDAAFTDEPYSVVTLKDAELSAMMKTVGDFVAGVDRDDTAIVYFSGHGMRDSDGDLYLCMKDSHEDQLDNTAYRFETLSKSIKRRNLRKVLIILDCCYSGAAGVKDSLTSKFNAVEEVGEKGTGTYVISSGGQTETSIEDKDKDYSLFTKVLAEGIRTGDADQNGNGVICVHEIARYVQREVPKRAAQQGRETTGREKRQQPQISSKAAFGEFPIAVNAAKAAEKKRRHDSAIARTWMEDGRKRLAEAVVAKEVEAHRLEDVDRWIAAQGNCETMDLSQPRLTALREYALRSIGLVPFCARWDAGAEISERPMAAAPEPEPLVPDLPAAAMAPPQQDVMATKSPDGTAAFDDVAAEPASDPDKDNVAPSLAAGLDRLLGAYKNGHVSENDYFLVEQTVTGGDCDEPRRQTLIDYGARSITLKTFNARWNASAETIATDPAAAASSDEPPVQTGLARLRKAQRNDEVSRSFVYAVEQWLTSAGENGDTERHEALMAYGAGSIDIGTLEREWAKALEAEPPTTAPSAATDVGADYSWIVVAIVGIAGLALGLFLVHLALNWLIDAVPPVDWSVPYAVWPPGFKILVVVGVLLTTIGLLYKLFELIFDYDAELALGIALISCVLLAGVYLLFYAWAPVMVELDAFFLRIMGVYDWVVGLFLPRP